MADCFLTYHVNFSLVVLKLVTLQCCGKQMAAVAALCVQYEPDFRPNMSIVVKALAPLLHSRSSNRPAASASTAAIASE